MNFVVLCSSNGTVFQSTLDALKDGSLTAHCLGLITDRSDRGCIQKAEAAGVSVKVVERKKNDDREEYDKKLNEAILELRDADPSYKLQTTNYQLVVACMGWLWIMSPWFIAKWSGKVLNVHPALLPKYGGEGMYGHHVHDAVLAANEKESGMTIHLMDEGVDTGKTLLQKTCPVEPGDTAETLCARVQALEKEAFPEVLQMIEEEKIVL